MIKFAHLFEIASVIGNAMMQVTNATIEIVTISLVLMPVKISETDAAAPVRAFCIA